MKQEITIKRLGRFYCVPNPFTRKKLATVIYDQLELELWFLSGHHEGWRPPPVMKEALTVAAETLANSAEGVFEVDAPIDQLLATGQAKPKDK